MIRTQIQLEEADYERLRAEAARRGCSVSAVVRDSVRATLAGSERARAGKAVMEAAGKYRSGKGDLAREHDKHLDEGW